MTSRVYALSEWVFRAMLVNLLWVAGTLAGAILLGLAPATLAAHHVARQYARGTDAQVVREFTACYRREFLAANAMLTPPAVVAAVAALGAVSLHGAGLPGGDVLAVVLLVVTVCLGLALLYLPSLVVHYDLPRTRALSRAFLFAVANLPSTVLLLLVLLAVGYASVRLPGLVPVATVGAWICASTALNLRFFAQNDAALGASPSAAP